MSIIRSKTRRGFPRTRKFFARFRRNTEAIITQSNRLELHKQGGEFFPAFFAALTAARQTICLEFYLIRDDAIGNELADLLIKAVQRGVTVYVLYDYIGCFDTPAAYFRRLVQYGIECRAFNPPPFRRGLTWFDKRDHRKIAVIDSSIAFAGGVNIGSEYSGFGDDHKLWRDLGVTVHGSAALQLQLLFNENWKDEVGVLPLGLGCMPDRLRREGDATVHIVSGGPHKNRSYIHNAYRLAIGGAAQSIIVANPYFIPGPRVIRSLLRAVKRGVVVQLILPAVSDVPLVRLVSRGTYAPLLRGGIRIHELEGTVLHAKVMLIDGCWSIIGSANLDHRSFHRNYETNLIVDSRSFGSQIKEMLAEDLNRSRRVVLEEHEKRGFAVRLLEWIAAPIRWFL